MNSRLRKGRGINFHDAAKARSLRDHLQPDKSMCSLWEVHGNFYGLFPEPDTKNTPGSISKTNESVSFFYNDRLVEAQEPTITIFQMKYVILRTKNTPVFIFKANESVSFFSRPFENRLQEYLKNKQDQDGLSSLSSNPW